MPQSLSRPRVHLIFSTKDRFPFLREPQVRTDTHAYLANVLRSHDCETLIVGGAMDHIHALFDLSRKDGLATIVREIKRTSSAWVKDVFPRCRKFHWQNGYGAFSVSQSELGRVYRYIEGQEEHHRRVSFHDEFKRFLEKYRIDYDERYVWD